MKVLVVPSTTRRAQDPTVGIWAHRQALAAPRRRRRGPRARPAPPAAPAGGAARSLDLGAVRRALAQPPSTGSTACRSITCATSHPPGRGATAAGERGRRPWLRRALARVRRSFAFDLVHAHYAVPAGDAVRRAIPALPLVVSVHGGDVYGPHAGAPAVRATLAHARLVLANSAGTARRCVERGARRRRPRGSCTSAPTYPPGAGARRIRRRRCWSPSAT